MKPSTRFDISDNGLLATIFICGTAVLITATIVITVLDLRRIEAVTEMTEAVVQQKGDK